MHCSIMAANAVVPLEDLCARAGMLVALTYAWYPQEWDNPIAGANKFKQQVWTAKLLGGGTG